MSESNDNLAYSRTLVALFKHVINKEIHREYWNTVINQKNRIIDYVGKIGLILILDETDGYCYLKQQTYGDGGDEIPRLIPRHALSYPVSLLLALLRKQLFEYDSATGDRRLIINARTICDHMRLFLRDSTNEAKIMNDITKCIERVEEMGFLRRLRGGDDDFEVQRVLCSFVDAEWLGNFNERLNAYKKYAESGENTNEKTGRNLDDADMIYDKSENEEPDSEYE